MKPTIVGMIVFVCTCGGALVGNWLRTTLPEHHLNDESRDTVKLGIGLIATMTALVLGLVTACQILRRDREARGCYEALRRSHDSAGIYRARDRCGDTGRRSADRAYCRDSYKADRFRARLARTKGSARLRLGPPPPSPSLQGSSR